MIREHTEIAILGAGFAGSLMALILNQTGRDVVLIEKNCHPRFAIGESSTPLANLSLEKLCRTYNLPDILPLCKYGSWQATHPELACGLKRGFSYFGHHPNKRFEPNLNHYNELLVAASPYDSVGDTHWFREHFDLFLIKEVQKSSISYLDRTDIFFTNHDDGWFLRGNREGEDIDIQADFVIDASGSSAGIAGALDLDCSPQSLRTRSWSVYSHFTDVELWENVLSAAGGSLTGHPFPCDDAALHHIFADGWIWVLRFNNGLTSAGIVFNGERASNMAALDAETIWKKTMGHFPSIADQFSKARLAHPFIRTARLQRRARQAAGEDWALLPHSAYFIDPFFSAGNAHSLLGLERLAGIFSEHWHKPSFISQLQVYNRKLQREIDFLDQLIHGSYCAFNSFELLTAFTMYYFVGAIYSETQCRQGASSEEDEFLFSHHEPFRTAVVNAYTTVLDLTKKLSISEETITAFTDRVAVDIAPYNLAGLCEHNKHNMYPFVQLLD